MNAAELRTKTIAELQEQLLEQLNAQVKTRFDISMDQSGQTHKLKEIRRNIARIRTLITEKTNGEDK